MWEKLWEILIRGDVENDEKYNGMCKKCCDAGRGNIELQYVDILQGVAQGCTLSPTLFVVYIHDVIVAVEAAKQGATVGKIRC